jgi:hypothetical protein
MQIDAREDSSFRVGESKNRWTRGGVLPRSFGELLSMSLAAVPVACCLALSGHRCQFDPAPPTCTSPSPPHDFTIIRADFARRTPCAPKTRRFSNDRFLAYTLKIHVRSRPHVCEVRRGFRFCPRIRISHRDSPRPHIVKTRHQRPSRRLTRIRAHLWTFAHLYRVS